MTMYLSLVKAEVLLLFHGKRPLINEKPFFKQCLKCRVKWKADLCSSAKHHLCWRGWRWPVPGWKNTTDLHGTQHTINGHLLWITHSKMSTRLQAATFYPPFQAREWGEAGSLLESPCSSTCTCIIHRPATIYSVRKWCQENRNTIAGYRGPIVCLKKLLAVHYFDPAAFCLSLFWSFTAGTDPKPKKNFGCLKFCETNAQTPTQVQLLFDKQVVEIQTVFKGIWDSLSVRPKLLLHIFKHK